MEYGARLCLFVLLLPVVYGVIRSDIGYEWVEPLPGSIDILEGDNVTLTYRYSAPSDVTGKVEVELSHHIPSNNYENVLIAANINPVNHWEPEVFYEHAHGRVLIEANDGKFTFHLANVQLNEWGRYWTDATFSTGKTLNHWIDLAVYQRYGWNAAPNRTTYIVAEHEHSLEFLPNVATDIPSLRYELFKITKQSVEPLLVYEMVDDAIKYESRGQNWRVNFNEARNGLEATIIEPTSLDGGRYLLKLTDTPKSTILAHHFNLVVFNETQLSPIIKTTPEYSGNNTILCMSIDVNKSAPKPDIIVYMGNATNMTNGSLPRDSPPTESAMTVYARANRTSQLEMCLARSAYRDIVVSVDLMYADMPGVRAEKQIKIPQIQLVDLGRSTQTIDKDESPILLRVSESNILLICILLVVILAVIGFVVYYLLTHRPEFHNKPRTDVVAVSSEDTLLANRM